MVSLTKLQKEKLNKILIKTKSKEAEEIIKIDNKKVPPFMKSEIGKELTFFLVLVKVK